MIKVSDICNIWRLVGRVSNLAAAARLEGDHAQARYWNAHQSKLLSAISRFKKDQGI